jgi:hypothetical protein
VVAHIALGSLLERLVIPRVIGPVAQRLVDDPPPRLTFAHLGVEGGEIPACFGLGAELVERALVRRIVRKVAKLLRVGLQIEKLIGIKGAAGVFPFAGPRAARRSLRRRIPSPQAKGALARWQGR